jgi:hypothetical protein
LKENERLIAIMGNPQRRSRLGVRQSFAVFRLPEQGRPVDCGHWISVLKTTSAFLSGMNGIKESSTKKSFSPLSGMVVRTANLIGGSWKDGK